MMLEHGNILILDEPTNHLDISMKEVIEDAMKTFTGTILFVSHDRYLLDQVADHILEIRPTGVKTYIGGFQSWLYATKKEAASSDAASFVWMPTAVYNRNPTEKRNVSLSGLNLLPPKRHAASHRTGPAMNPQPSEA